MDRRQLLRSSGLGLMGGTVTRAVAKSVDFEGKAPGGASKGLSLSEYEPKSMLNVRETHVPKPRFPVVDIHTHLTWSKKVTNGVALASEREILGTPEECLAVMDRKNIHSLINLTGGYGSGLAETVRKYDVAHPDRFITFAEPSYELFLQPDYPKLQAQAIEQAHRDGARGLKILKTLGLYLRDNITTGRLINIDDPRFDPMWDTCGQLNLPVAIHVSDPVAFFSPTDRFNERYEELSNHPDWSFCGGDFPSNAELLESRNHVIARHPKTQFMALHVGNFAENLANVSENLDRFPNMTVDIAARIGELGRQPRTARDFFDKYQDRILFGTDATPHGNDFPQQLFNDTLYEIYYRFLETDDEYFDYAPAKTPPQGRWQIYGVNLSESILRKVYNANAARELRLNL